MKILIVQDTSKPLPKGMVNIVEKLKELGHEIVYDSLDMHNSTLGMNFDMVMLNERYKLDESLLYDPTETD